MLTTLELVLIWMVLLEKNSVPLIWIRSLTYKKSPPSSNSGAIPLRTLRRSCMAIGFGF
jgi:hypothetical protein